MPPAGPARRASSKPETPTEPAPKKAKTYDDDTINAGLRAVFPNWTPEDPMFMLKHGFAEPDQILRRTSMSSASPSRPATGRGRNAEHNLSDISTGPYSDFLDRYGQKPEYYPAAMIRQLESHRKNADANADAAAAASKSQSQSPDDASPEKDLPGGRRRPAFVVMHTQRGGYAISDTSFALHGVFARLELANVRAMEIFQKRHRNFMLTNFPESPGSAEIPFVQSRDQLRVLTEDECEASWWVDGGGCLSLRAANWGSGDGRIFVVKQDLDTS
ncbi:hypothetical protein F5Y15DRAFT_307955 [Xylariaceae sp. FL0016]|nr:hypothetical protein F5Y15DRAFT_307955 [Xylariaceae sp. FL0016]